ncbi:rCG36831 [Rattus norvegicus]|uniref:RCG36831 n=1 Tax=Rattus norvegicus TaxID=10116 RepID=A6HUC2_RAT|nr:rCG36831 [Rattus norvegicus]
MSVISLQAPLLFELPVSVVCSQPHHSTATPTLFTVKRQIFPCCLQNLRGRY